MLLGLQKTLRGGRGGKYVSDESQIMTSISLTFQARSGKYVSILQFQIKASLPSRSICSPLSVTTPLLLKPSNLSKSYSCSYTLASTHDLSWLHQTFHIHPCRPCLSSHLNVFLGEKPRSVGQDFVELSELLQLLRGFKEAVQPLGISPNLKEVVDVQVD